MTFRTVKLSYLSYKFQLKQNFPSFAKLILTVNHYNHHNYQIIAIIITCHLKLTQFLN